MKFGHFWIQVGYQCAIAGLVALPLSVGFAHQAIAGSDDFPVLPQGVRFGEIPYEFENQFFSNGRDFVSNRTFKGQLKRWFGPFPENSINRDSKAVQGLFRDTLYHQLNSGPVLRTVDLPNPFQFSLRTLPPPPVVTPVEVIPPPIVDRPLPVVPEDRPAATPAKPIPALW